MSPLRLAIAVVVVVVTAVAVVGIGQGDAPQTPSPGARYDKASIARVAKGGDRVQRGKRLFETEGCNRCHAMAAGGYDGRLGPRLDVVTQGDSVRDTIGNITQPRGDIADGYDDQRVLMPDDYAKRIDEDDITALALYVHAAAGSGK